VSIVVEEAPQAGILLRLHELARVVIQVTARHEVELDKPQSSSQQSTKRVGQRTRCNKDAHSEEELRLLVEATEEECRSRHGTAFEDT